MNPAPGQYVKIIFKYGTITAEGFVQEWSDIKSVLKTEDGILLIVQQTAQDVLAVKIMPRTRPKVEVEQKYEEVKAVPKKDNLSIKKLAELKIELNRQEREDLVNRVRTHEFSNIQPVNNVSPFNTTQSRVIERPAEESPRTNFRLSPAMSAMFRRKNKDNG